MKSPYYWLCKYREYSFASQCKKLNKNELESKVSNIFDNSVYGWKQDIEIIERRIYQTLIYRNKVIGNYPYDYSEIVRWDELLRNADTSFEALLKYYKKEASNKGIKFKKFKNMIKKLSHSEKEYNSILLATGLED